MSKPMEPGAPAAKAPPPELFARAPRPRPVRVRPAAAIALGLAAAMLLGGALAWSLVIRPQLRQMAQPPATDAARPVEGATRPSEIITRQPATYAQPPGALPPPRRPGGAGDAHSAPAPRSAPPRAARHGQDSSADLRRQARRSGLLFAAAPAATAPSVPSSDPPAAASAGAAAASSGARLRSPASPFALQAGAIIPATLLTAVDSARPGAVLATTTQSVYDSVTGRTLLIPQGARLIGRQDGASKYGDRRVFLVWDRLILPNGKDLRLEAEPAVDPQGALGLRGRANRRSGPLALATLFAGAITTLGQAARDHDDGEGGWLGDAGDAAAIQAAQVGGRLVGRELDVAPSLRLSAGAAVRVLVTHDLMLEPYAP